MTRGIRVVGAGVSADDAATLPPVAAQRPAKAETPARSEVAAKTPPRKLWSGRLGGRTSRRLEEFSSSVALDHRLYAEDITASLAHAAMLRRIELLTAAELRSIEQGLRAIRREFDRGEFVFDPSDEDIHSAVERRLFELAGEVAGKLHTGRSRNDQVATDLRLYAKRVARELMLAVADCQQSLLRRAEQHRSTVMPGYTHLQRAQPVSLAHHLLSWVEMLQRDVERFTDAHSRADWSPLGSGAIAGSTLPLDRAAAASELDFGGVSGNSIDSVSDRDFAADLIYACAMTMGHLSRIAEELVLWCTAEFGFVELPDSLATGSSLMPQKKNPDALELIRGRSARTIGDVTAMLALLKGLPLAYNRDLQEDKQILFDAIDVTLPALAMLTEVADSLVVNAAAMREAASDPALLATDVAEHLVRTGVPFREAHTIVASAVRKVAKQHRSLADLSVEEWQAVDPRVDEGVTGLFDTEAALRRRELPGGPAPRSVSRQLVRAATLIERTRRSVTVLSRQPGRVKEVGAGRRRADH